MVLSRLKHIQLYEYNDKRPIIFVKADNPDEACHLAYVGLEKLISKSSSKTKKTTVFIEEIFEDVRILRAMVANETKL